MSLRQPVLEVAARSLRSLLKRLPGKMRLARLVARAAGEKSTPVTLAGVGGETYLVPSLKEPIALEIIAYGRYEAETIDTILEHLPPQGVFLDVGANIGAISIPIAMQRPNATIIAIEASPRIFELLCRNIEANGLTNISPVHACAADEDRESVSFNEAPDAKFGMGSIFARFGGPGTPVRQSRIDGVLQSHQAGIPHVLKLDIEGAELLALAGARECLAHSSLPPVVVFEFCDWAEASLPGQTPGAAQRYLIDLGYALQILGPQAPGRTFPLRTGAAMIVARKPLA